jgi:hypothetical protein
MDAKEAEFGKEKEKLNVLSPETGADRQVQVTEVKDHLAKKEEEFVKEKGTLTVMAVESKD